jgi:hypothetical protein
MFAKLTETSPGVFELPVIKTTKSIQLVMELTPDGKHRVSVGRLPAPARLLYGWADFHEEAEHDHVLGAPLDTFDGTTVTRTYPNSTPRPPAPPAPPTDAEEIDALSLGLSEVGENVQAAEALIAEIDDRLKVIEEWVASVVPLSRP